MPHPPFTVVSANVRNSAAPDGPHAWPARRADFIDLLRRLDADVFAVQEALPDQHDDLAAAFPSHAAVGVGRDDGDRRGEFCTLLLRRDRFDVLPTGTFWLAEAPDRPGVLGWDAAFPRICTWARVRDRLGDRPLLVANTHLDHLGSVAQHESARLLRARLTSAGVPIILAGDFNLTEDDAVYADFLGADTDHPWLDAYRLAHPARSPEEATYHGFTGTTTGSRIDWILHTADLTPLAATIVHATPRAGVYPSDHHPIATTLGWTDHP